MLAMVYSNGGQRMPDATRFKMEAAEQEELFLVNVWSYMRLQQVSHVMRKIRKWNA